MKPIPEQVAILQKHFPHLKYTGNHTTGYAVPRWQSIASAYGEAVEKVLKEIESTRPFKNYIVGELGPAYLGETPKKHEFMHKLGMGIVVLDAQLGEKHKGKSVQGSRASFAESEFGLGAFEVGCILLTHPERLQSSTDLWVDCAGDESNVTADGDFSDAPVFDFDDGRV